jgi:hypothetical protein
MSDDDALTDTMARGLIELAAAIRDGRVQSTRADLDAIIDICERQSWFLISDAFRQARLKRFHHA